MTMQQLELEVELRTEFGKNANRRVRAAGNIPAVVYGGDHEPAAIVLGQRRLRELMKTGGDNPVFLLKLAGTDQSRHVMIREHQMDPVTGRSIHLDFQRVVLDQVVRVTVPVEIVGTALGVKNEGGILDFVTREVEIECLPTQIPESLAADVSGLHVGDHLEAEHLALPEGVKLLEDEERVIVSIAAPKAEEVDEDDEDALLTGAGSAEPERIGRTREDEED